FMASYPEREPAEQALGARIQAAVPSFMTTESWNHLVAALPPCPAAADLKDMIAKVCPTVPTSMLDSDGDLTFCFDSSHLSLAQFSSSLALDETQFSQLVRQGF